MQYFRRAMKGVISISLVIMGGALWAQEFPTLKVYISDQKQKALADVWLKLGPLQGYTDQQGSWQGTLTAGKYKLSLSYLGYRDTALTMKLRADTTLRVSLKPYNILLRAAEVRENRYADARTQIEEKIDRIRVHPRAIHSTNSLLGEPDITRPLLFAPGIQSGIGGSADFYVRGSELYQNALYLDGFPAFNLQHGFGFYHPVPVGAVSNLSLHKQDFPLELGRGGSSVLDVSMQAGRPDDWAGEFGIGLGSLQGGVTIPFKKEQAHLRLNGRYANFTPLLKGLSFIVGQQEPEFLFGFHDFSAKYHHPISEGSYLEALYFNAQDWVENLLPYSRSLSLQRRNAAGTQVAGLRWVQRGKRWQQSHRVFYSQLALSSELGPLNPGQDLSGLEAETVYQSGFRPVLHLAGGRSEWRRAKGKHQLKMGGVLQRYQLRAPSMRSQSRTEVRHTPGWNHYLWNTGLYVEDLWQLHPKWQLKGGLRVDGFQGNAYENEMLWQPKGGLTYSPSPQWSYFLRYDRRINPLQRARLNTYGSLIDMPLLPEGALKVSGTDQATLGASWAQEKMDVQVSAFYRKFESIPVHDFKKGMYSYLIDRSSGLSPSYRHSMVDAQGYAYGMELATSLDWKIFSWDLSYTYTDSWRKSSALNNGRYFPFTFNRRHMLAGTFKTRFKRNALNKITELVLSYRYGSPRYTTFPGQAVSLPRTRRGFGYVGERHNVQLPPMNLLSLSFNFIALRKGHRRTFTISLSHAALSPPLFRYTSEGEKPGHLRGQGMIPLFGAISYYINL